ncbi:hypothetical protein GY45DRAFT_728417 [Cubamyces sp. BRFM 1775]|nr:hypothetical protein GY45DRAFT_728417 [Cubamyces sp. BRFM 1775]
MHCTHTRTHRIRNPPQRRRRTALLRSRVSCAVAINTCGHDRARPPLETGRVFKLPAFQPSRRAATVCGGVASRQRPRPWCARPIPRACLSKPSLLAPLNWRSRFDSAAPRRTVSRTLRAARDKQVAVGWMAAACQWPMTAVPECVLGGLAAVEPEPEPIRDVCARAVGKQSKPRSAER